ncbi:response regulator [Sphingomonas radiodurans]|uniref:response regulator n=1 Tax=Sphingomonas radiodurans TaxID=2890321 RepID=UPI001E28ABFB|nr:response regulator [Sphingomonas radiodurans]WBH17452.1 response regulator [Sphingomonas radiodurans]
MSAPTPDRRIAPSILIVDGDVITRHAIADYLRHCGYAVVEAASTDEAMKALPEPSLGIDVILCDVAAVGEQSAQELSSWVRANRPELEVRLASTVEAVADTAAELCESGPNLARPYEPQAVIDYVKQLRATRDRATAA